MATVKSPNETSTLTPAGAAAATRRVGGGLLDPHMLWKSLPDAVKKLDPRVQLKNPVMFVVEVGSMLTTYSAIIHSSAFSWLITVWLWLTVIFANLAEAVADSCERVMPDAPFDFRAALTRSMVDGYQTFLVKAADGIREAGGFDEPEQWRYDWEFTYTRDAWLDVVPTQGAFTRLPPDKLAEILTAVGAAIDARGGTVTMPYATLAVTARRT